MLFSSQLFGRIWFGEVRVRPNGEATWQLQMFRFCIAQLIKNNKRCHPGVDAIWETADNSSSPSLLNGWLFLSDSFQVISLCCFQPLQRQETPTARLLLNIAHRTVTLNTGGLSIWQVGIRETPNGGRCDAVASLSDLSTWSSAKQIDNAVWTHSSVFSARLIAS